MQRSHSRADHLLDGADHLVRTSTAWLQCCLRMLDQVGKDTQLDGGLANLEACCDGTRWDPPAQALGHGSNMPLG